MQSKITQLEELLLSSNCIVESNSSIEQQGDGQELIRTKIGKDCEIDDIPELLIQYFNNLPTVPDTNFIVARYKALNEKKEQKICKVNVKKQKIEEVETVGGEVDILVI